MSDLFRPCPFCGSRTEVWEVFGQLAAGCRNRKCKMRPDTWLHAGNMYDVRDLAKFWNKSFTASVPTPPTVAEGE